MIYLAVCDDEKYYREQLEELVTRYINQHQLNSIVQIELFSSGKELCHKKSELNKYDIIFLDISMDELNGLETAYKIRQYRSDSCIVFVTSFVNYALEGYKVDAFRYILKDSMEDSMEECLDAVFKKLKAQLHTMEFKFIEGKKSVVIDKIVYIESQKHKLIFYILDNELKKYTMYTKLDDIEEQLMKYKFLRIHKSYLVNLNYINRVGSYKVTLTLGQEFTVPKSRYQTVKEEYALFKGEL